MPGDIARDVDFLSTGTNDLMQLKLALAGAALAPLRRAMPAILALPDAESVATALRPAFEGGEVGDSE